MSPEKDELTAAEEEELEAMMDDDADDEMSDEEFLEENEEIVYEQMVGDGCLLASIMSAYLCRLAIILILILILALRRKWGDCVWTNGRWWVLEYLLV